MRLPIFWISILIILVLPITLATSAEEAQRIYTSEELIIEHTTASNLNIPSGITEAKVELAYFPQITFRQEILEQQHNPNPSEFQSNLQVFVWDEPQQGTVDFIVKTKVRTKNAYLPVTDKIVFPLDTDTIPTEYFKFLESSDNIDINEDIIVKASSIASGKDDLYDVAHSVAAWVEANIEYDLSTLTATVSQPASWTLQNRAGVCDELTSLFIAMMRSLGVPTRFVSGMSYTNSELFAQPWGPHAWAEVYFPDHGWVPFDLTYRQFGHVDASHIKLKVASDADESFTRYTWTGYGNQVSMEPLTLQTEVLEYVGTLEPTISFDATVAYDAIGIGSSNLLHVDVQNKKDHYVSTTLRISAPQEVEIPKYTTVLLKPGEKKKLTFPMHTEQLDDSFIYTMPISVSEIYGAESETQFKIASQYPTYSRKFIASQTVEDAKNNQGKIKTECKAQPHAIAGSPFSLVCTITNTGNIFYEDLKICLDEICDTVSLGINQGATLTKEMNLPQPQTVSVELSGQLADQEFFTQPISFEVVGKPQLEITQSFPNSVGYEDSAPYQITIAKEGGATALNARVEVYAGVDPYIYTPDRIDRPHILEGTLNGFELAEGENQIRVVVQYEDASGEQYFEEYTYTVIGEDFSMWQKIKSATLRFLRGIF